MYSQEMKVSGEKRKVYQVTIKWLRLSMRLLKTLIYM